MGKLSGPLEDLDGFEAEVKKAREFMEAGPEDNYLVFVYCSNSEDEQELDEAIAEQGRLIAFKPNRRSAFKIVASNPLAPRKPVPEGELSLRIDEKEPATDPDA